MNKVQQYKRDTDFEMGSIKMLIEAHKGIRKGTIYYSSLELMKKKVKRISEELDNHFKIAKDGFNVWDIEFTEDPKQIIKKVKIYLPLRVSRQEIVDYMHLKFNYTVVFLIVRETKEFGFPRNK